MKTRFLLYIVLFLLIGSGCTENETFVYSSRPAVFFNGLEDVNFSFAGQTGDTAVVNLQVGLLGQKLEMDKKYVVRVNPEATTAKEGLHYKALGDAQVFPAEKFFANLEIELYRKDPELQDSTFYLDLSIVNGEEIDAAYADRCHVRIGIVDQLLKPDYWDSWLKLYYSDYSRVKHNVCIAIQGHDFPLTEQEARGGKYGPQYWMVMGRAVCLYFINHPTVDENGNPITVWEPF